jgi:hypothetical protein
MSSERESAGIVRAYESFFNRGLRLRIKETESETWQGPIDLHPVIAAGSLIRGTIEEREVAKIGLESLLANKSAEWFFNEERGSFAQGYVTQGIGYGFVGRLLQGKSAEEAADELQETHNIFGAFSLQKSHNLEPFTGTTLFFDWDGTCAGDFNTSHRLRPGLVGFLISLLAEQQGENKYQTFITTNSFSTKSFLDRYEGALFKEHERQDGRVYRLFDLFDAIDTVPGAPSSVSGTDFEPHFGKFYMELLQALDIAPERSLILCDSYADRNIDTSSPITTLVTGPHVHGEDWAVLLHALEERGANMHDAYHTFGEQEQLGSLSIYTHEAHPYTLFLDRVSVDPARTLRWLGGAMRYANRKTL